ncbi:zinc-binding dehydrogenase [Nocardiopsis sp. HNM0947]|uniref:Zinc-binding dehydrogenase n=1 Tax=Nocardiopsis coralli TaxID=2772213 RepID=A0ABR9P6S2_9ACTN|nr:zinc-binding dehydrogenase [Nocardiopsis coralli]MBE2999549.1 zinc-binding dehydrogenase [Nocardiopsis coralli]
MKAIVMDRFGSPEVLGEGEVQDAPAPGPGQVRVRVVAAAVNPVDNQVRSGSKGEDLGVPLPMVLGWDLAGEVESVGADVPFDVGDAVVGMSAQPATGVGTWSQWVTLDHRLLAPAPVSVPLRDAAALPLAALSSYQPLSRLDLPRGARLLVTGGVGAVGGFAVQIARRRGWRAAVLVREGDQAEARSLGAAEVYTQVPEEGGFDAVFETAGVAGAIRAVRRGGRFVTVVPTAVPEPERGVEPEVSFVDQDGASLRVLADWVDRQDLTVRVAQAVPFARAAEAVRRFEAGGVRGKVLLLPPAQ